MALWLAPDPLVLASKSAARSAMLKAAGVPIEVRHPEIDERALESDVPAEPGELALMLARAKAGAVAKHMPARLVAGADQILVLGLERFTKPADRAAAGDQLRALRGHTHSLYSAVAVVRDRRVLYEHIDQARLTMRRFSDSFLESYLDAAGDAVTESVGAYQVEGMGIQLFERIEGDHFTILGLPLTPLLAFLREEGSLA